MTPRSISRWTGQWTSAAPAAFTACGPNFRACGCGSRSRGSLARLVTLLISDARSNCGARSRLRGRGPGIGASGTAVGSAGRLSRNHAALLDIPADAYARWGEAVTRGFERAARFRHACGLFWWKVVPYRRAGDRHGPARGREVACTLRARAARDRFPERFPEVPCLPQGPPRRGAASTERERRSPAARRGVASIRRQPSRSRWCPPPDSNRQGRSRRILSPVRLPIPPGGRPGRRVESTSARRKRRSQDGGVSSIGSAPRSRSNALNAAAASVRASRSAARATRTTPRPSR